MIQRCSLFSFLLWLTVTTAFGTHSSPPATSHRPPPNVAARSRLFRPPNKRAFSESVKVATSLDGGSANDIPSFSKSPEEYKFIKEALLENVMFTNLPKATLDRLIDAFEWTTVSKDQVVVKQGELCEGDYVYMIGDGKCTVIVDGKVVPEPYGTLKPKAIFGELGVLYNQTRSATITGKSDSVSLFRVNGETFKAVLNRLTSNDDPELLEQIDQAINQLAGTKSLYGGNIIRPYKPNRKWLWGRWKVGIKHSFYRGLFRCFCNVVAPGLSIEFIFIILIIFFTLQ